MYMGGRGQDLSKPLSKPFLFPDKDLTSSLLELHYGVYNPHSHMTVISQETKRGSLPLMSMFCLTLLALRQDFPQQLRKCKPLSPLD